jgi:hypothetical protein
VVSNLLFFQRAGESHAGQFFTYARLKLQMVKFRREPENKPQLNRVKIKKPFFTINNIFIWCCQSRLKKQNCQNDNTMIKLTLNDSFDDAFRAFWRTWM